MAAPDPARVDALARTLGANVKATLDNAAKLGPLTTETLIRAVVGAVALELARAEATVAALVKSRTLAISPDDIVAAAKALPTG